MGCASFVCYRRQVLSPEQVVPPLVLLPGTLCDGRLFAPLLARLPQLAGLPAVEAHVFLTTDCDSIHAMAESVLSAAPSQFALLGFSLGGLVGMEVALLTPERVLGLALLDVNAAPVPPTDHAARREAVEQARFLGPGRYLCDRLWSDYVGPACQKDVEMQRLLASMAQDLGHEAFRHQTEAALSRRDYRPLLPTLSVPALVLAGEHDAICPAAAQREFAEAMPHALFVLVPDAGHFALLEQPDAVAASVAAWFHTTAGACRPPRLAKEKT